MNEYEAHLGSYDHSHRQRMKDMKAMVRDPNATARARRQEARDVGVVSIKLGGNGEGETGTGGGNKAGTGAAGGAGGFKKGGFKKTGFKAAFAPAVVLEEEKKKEESRTQTDGLTGGKGGVATNEELEESDTEDEGYEMYDPRHPTD
jgi:hypothetical protein